MKLGHPFGYYVIGFKDSDVTSFVRLILENANMAMIKKQGKSTSTAKMDLLLTYTIIFFLVRLLN